ncbi:MAG: hypothetical protein OER80_08125 [Gammaproteobacteria bacterium]|nr:hypothetical protein [Gammaproteobacteria bacterium]
MHAGTEQLLTIRDGGPVDAATQQHVAGCSECGDELIRLRAVRESLRELPELRVPTGAWERLESRLNEPAIRSHWWPGVVVAATVLIAVAIWVFSGIEQTTPNETAPMIATNAEPELGQLVSQSRRLEALLRELDTPRVMNAGTAGTIAGLQDGIAVIDYGLSRNGELSQSQSEQLWRQRVGLMNTLVQVRGAQLQQVSN